MRSPTDSQWRAIRAADEHVLVAAGAGTGKTSTVVGRILWLLGVPLRDETYRAKLGIRDIGAITFTNAAAADLKRRLREELRAYGLRREAYEVDNARIGTIHGFCGDILREFALRSGGDPRMRVLEEGEGAALAAETVREAVLVALEERRIAGLEELLAERSTGDVEKWVCRLIGDGDRLRRIALHAGALGAHERALLELARFAESKVSETLEAAGAVDFDRMIVRTRDLLRADDRVRRALQRRLRVLIVDEFQDVDPVQKEIAYLLGEPAGGRAETTRLLLVGDPKQSIFRFRRADVTVWRGVQADFEAGQGRVVALEENFRSTPPILAFVDAAVGPVLSRPVEGDALRDYEIAFQPVKAQQDGEPRDRAVELLVVPQTGDGKPPKLEVARAQEAAAVARRAVELRAEGVKLGEMAVLLASWSDAAVYQEALERAGLPTYALRGEGYYGRREVQDLVLALETLRDPREDRALLGFLRSPFGAVKDETLLEIARRAEAPYWDHVSECRVGEQALLDRAVALLREHVALRDRIPTHELLERLLERSGYRAHLHLLGRDGEQALANVRKFLGLARRLGDHSVGDFLRIVKEARDRGDREGDARLYGQRDEVVTITSIHSSKGLEWSVVFWCDLARQPQGVKNDESLLVGRDRLVLKQPDVEPAEQLQWAALKQDEEREMAAERKRLWYVAATRARHRLIVGGLLDGKMHEGCPAAALRGQLAGLRCAEGALVAYTGQEGRTFSAVVRLAGPVPGSEPVEPEDPWTRALPGLPAPPAAFPVPLGRARHSATELMAYDRCGRRHWLRYLVGLKEPPVERGGAAFLSAVVRGQIVHDVLEHLGEEERLDPLLEAAIGRWDEHAPAPETAPGRRYREALREEIGLVAGHPEYRAIDGRPGRRRELGFLHILGREGFIEGKMDLAAPEGDGLVLLDVKTHQGADDLGGKARGYELQRHAYTAAAEAIAGAPVARFAFHFSRAGAQVSIPVTDEERARGAEALGRLLAGLGVEEPALTRHPAECGYCGYKRAGWCEGAPGITGETA